VKKEKRKEKKILLLVLLLCGVAYSGFSQQLTRFAVVDLPKVYMAFFSASRPVREWEERSAAVQNDINRMNREIQTLRSQHADAVTRGDQSEALRLETEINRRSAFAREYYTVKTAELAEQRRTLSQSGAFLEQVHSEIRSIAESEGYTMVLSLTENTGILWHSPTVDITDMVIRNLQSRTRR
jgi:outer membrane protein